MSSFDETLATLGIEMNEVIKDLKDIDIDKGVVAIPVALFFQVLGIIAWLASTEETDGADPS